MNFLVERKGWGVVVELDDEAAYWLARFISTKRIRPEEEMFAVSLHNALSNAIGR